MPVLQEKSFCMVIKISNYHKKLPFCNPTILIIAILHFGDGGGEHQHFNV
jgi:hypothetical protein